MLLCVCVGVAFCALAAPGELEPITVPVQAAPAPQENRAQFREMRLDFTDEAPKQADFQAFRDTLIAAVDRKDTAFLLEHVSADIKCSFGMESGIADFTKMWKLDTSPATSEIWHELKEVLRLGGVFRDGAFVAPYVFETFPDDFDAFEYGAITGDNVNVRERPDLGAPSVARVSRLVVRMLYEENPQRTKDPQSDDIYPWQKVVLPSGQVGYVFGKYVRSPIDYRAFFAREGATWKMQFFVAGD